MLGALGAAVVTACGDRDIGGTYPTDPFPTQPLTIKVSDFPELAVVGGMARGGEPCCKQGSELLSPFTT